MIGTCDIKGHTEHRSTILDVQHNREYELSHTVTTLLSVTRVLQESQGTAAECRAGSRESSATEAGQSQSPFLPPPSYSDS